MFITIEIRIKIDNNSAEKFLLFCCFKTKRNMFFLKRTFVLKQSHISIWRDRQSRSGIRPAARLRCTVLDCSGLLKNRPYVLYRWCRRVWR